jgi:hypothetical protein
MCDYSSCNGGGYLRLDGLFPRADAGDLALAGDLPRVLDCTRDIQSDPHHDKVLGCSENSPRNTKDCECVL